MKKLIVTGLRTCERKDLVYAEISKYISEIGGVDEIVSGGSGGVDAHRRVDFGFGLVYGGVRGGVDDPGRAQGLDQRGDGFDGGLDDLAPVVIRGGADAVEAGLVGQHLDEKPRAIRARANGLDAGDLGHLFPWNISCGRLNRPYWIVATATFAAARREGKLGEGRITDKEKGARGRPFLFLGGNG